MEANNGVIVDIEHIQARIEELCRLACKRIDSTAYAPGIQYAEILWLTPAEAVEFLELRQRLPSSGQLAREARNRLICKIIKRNIFRISSS